ncbi:MAG: protein kinase [Vicinamibacterales bacterium]
MNERDVDGLTPRNERFAPGDVVADRYRIVALVGRGGMGEVWRADDLILETPVALKLLHGSQDEYREQVLNEVRISRQVTHPSVCRVFDIGEIDGEAFLSMEFVHGEDLAALLKRAGRLPPEKVVDIAHQLCSGVAAAHSRGVLHRDLKPANLLVDDAGQICITDFGIAVATATSKDQRSFGTPRYMAPEQLAHAAPSSEQTDIYALGLVLYEVLTGHHPLEPGDGRLDPDARLVHPSELIEGVDPRLERAIVSALAREPRERPESARAMQAMLPPLDGTSGGESASAGPEGPAYVRSIPANARWWYLGFAAAAAVLLGAALAARLFTATPALTDKDTIIVSDIVNTTGDAEFDGTIKQALAVALEQSPFLQVASEERVQDTLRLMGRPDDPRLTAQAAREVAEREGFKAVLSGSIASLGRNYVISLEAMNAETSEVMARQQVEAQGKERVLETLGTITARLREQLGESLPSIARFNAPLERATTPSLAALKAYTTAMEHLRAGPSLDALPFLRRAIELDPEFGLAYAQLSAVYANTRQPGLAPPLSERAFELRDRVSERERFLISWRYYRDATQNWEKALELARSWAAAYPREAAAFNSLGLANLELGRTDDAIAAFEQSRTIDPGFLTPYLNLGSTFMTLGRYADARVPLQYAWDHGNTGAIVMRYLYMLAFAQNDSASMERLERQATGTVEEYAAFSWKGRRQGFLGQNRAAHATMRQGIQLAIARGLDGPAAQMETEDAEIHALAGECRAAKQEVASGLGFSRDNFTLERASRVLAWCGDAPGAQVLVQELVTRFPEATQTLHRWIPVTNAVLALRRNEPARVIEALNEVGAFATAAQFWPAYLRGLAYQQLGDVASARRQFQAIADNRGQYVFSPLYALAHIGLSRLAAVDGQIPESAAAYDRALAIWKDADADLPQLREARRERASLR